MANGRCKMHGGKSTGPALKHGRRTSPSNPCRVRLSERAARLEAQEQQRDLNRELAFARAVFADWLEQHDGAQLEPEHIREALHIIKRIGALVDRVERIRKATTLTKAETKYLQVRLADLLTKYLPEPETRAAFVAELRQNTST